MTPEQKERIRELFLVACEKDPQQRRAFLQHACQGDELVCREVESLLANDDEADAFLQTPVLGKTFADANPESLLADATPVAEGGRATAPSRTEPLPDTFPKHIGQYRILGILGTGGMGIVYRAEQESPRRPVALKVIRPGAESREALKRFEQEGQVLGKLQHPGIAQVFEAGTADTGQGSQPFFAMELVHGQLLTEYAHARHLGLRARLELIARVCDAVHHAHQKGVIHRDLKPGNILVGETGQPKILDFGVARATDADVRTVTLQTAVGQLVGTIAYMSPEQIEGDPHDLDTRSDVYSVGVILYELLTGRVPVEVSAKTIPQAARAIIEQEPAPLSSVNRVFRGDIETIVAKALQKDRERRYQSASDFADDIRRYLSDQPIAARPVTTMYQLRKFVRRNKTLVTSVVVAFVVLCVALIGVTVERNRALEAEVLAEKRRQRAEYKAYVANIAAAHAAIAADDVVTARSRLDLAPAGLRKFEWHYLNARLDQSPLKVEVHEDWVWSVAFDPTGERAASASRDKTTKILDVRTGQVLNTLSDDEVGMWAVAYSPDGSFIATGLEDGRIVLWDAQTGEQLTTLRGHTDRIDCIAFNADGSLIASASLDSTVRLWDARAGSTVGLLNHPSWAYFVSFNLDGTRLATSCRDNQARIWDLTVPEPKIVRVLSPKVGNRDCIHAWPVVYSPDGQILAAGTHDGLIRLWDATTGELLRTMAGHADRIRTLAFGPTGERLASASFDRTVRVWDVASGVETGKFIGHEDLLLGVAYSPDGSRLASAGLDRSIRFWDPRVSDRFTELWGHENEGIHSLAVTPNGSRLVSVGGDAVVRVWDPISGAGVRALRGHRSYVYDVAISPDGKLVATASADRMVGVWDISTGNTIGMLAGHNDEVEGVAFTRDGAHVASAGRDGTVRLWDVSTCSEVMTIRSESGSLTAVAISPDGRIVATGSHAGSIELWEAHTGQRTRGGQAHDAAVSRIVFSPDGKRLASASHDHTVRLWDAHDLSLQNTLRGHADIVTGAAFNPDGSRLASVSFDRTLRLWDVETGETVLSFQADNSCIQDVGFSADGTWMASSARSIRLWETQRPPPNVLQQRLARTLAENLVERLSVRLKTVDEVIARIKLEADIEDDVRQLAIRTAKFRRP